MEALITMTGYVGGEVEARPTRLTNSVSATFRLACTPRLNRRGTWTDGETTWLTVTCYRSLAENAAASLRKGDPVVVSGKLRTQIWNDDDGVRHERVVLEAATIGHDLSRGTTEFRRADRPAPEDDGREMGEMITSVEAQPRSNDSAGGGIASGSEGDEVESGEEGAAGRAGRAA